MKRILRGFIRAGGGVVALGLMLVPTLVTPVRGAGDVALSLPDDAATVRDVTFTRKGRSEVIAVSVDQPFIFSYYPLSSPARGVVELARTDPGTSAEKFVYPGELARQIRIVRHDTETGPLTRLECFLADGTDFSVRLAPDDDRKLLITFTAQSISASPPPRPLVAQTAPFAASRPASPVAPPDRRPGAGSPSLPAVAQQRSRPAAGAQADAPPAVPAVSPSHGVPTLFLTEIAVTPAGIDIILDGPPVTYAAFPLDKPNRMVVDLPGVLVGFSAKVIPINSFGIARVRVGEHRGKSRLVFEGASEAVLRTVLVWRERGFRLLPAVSGTAPKPQEVRPERHLQER